MNHNKLFEPTNNGKEVFVRWNEGHSYEDFTHVRLNSEKFVEGTTYFENENYKLIAEKRTDDAFYLYAVWFDRKK